MILLQAGETFDMMSYLVTVCPAVGILGWFVLHLIKENRSKDARIEQLTNENIEMAKDQIAMGTMVKGVLDEIKQKL